MLDSPDIRSPRTVRIHLLDGTANGLLSAEIGGRTPLVMVAPRSRFSELLRRDETNRTGLYIFSGFEPEQIDKRKIYIGKGDCLRKRLRFQLSNNVDEDYQRLAIIVSSNDSLTTSQNQFLESKLILLARQTNRAIIQNAVDPNPPLNDFERTEAKEFLESTLTILPLLDFDFFRPILLQSPTLVPESSSQPLFKLEGSGVVASARETDDGFVVLAGSTARLEATPTLQVGYRLLRDQLTRDGKLVPSGKTGLLRFTSDVVFSSPSSAASVVQARSASGPQDWRVQNTNQSYKDWQAAQLRESVAS